MCVCVHACLWYPGMLVLCYQKKTKNIVSGAQDQPAGIRAHHNHVHRARPLSVSMAVLAHWQ